MRTAFKPVAALTAVALLSACAGRAPAPVAINHVGDKELACTQLGAEIAGNEMKMVQLQQEHDKAHNANIAIGVVGALLFWPALFALDTSTAQQDEIAALRQRNTVLAAHQATKGC